MMSPLEWRNLSLLLKTIATIESPILLLSYYQGEQFFKTIYIVGSFTSCSSLFTMLFQVLLTSCLITPVIVNAIIY